MAEPRESVSDYDKAVRILRGVRSRTEAKSLSWKARAQRTDAYDADMSGGNVEIGYADDDGAPPFDFKIFTPGPPYELIFQVDGRGSPELEADLQALHSLVARQVLGVDVVLDALLDELEAGDG